MRFLQGRVVMLPARPLSFCTNPVAHVFVVPALCKLRKGRGTLCLFVSAKSKAWATRRVGLDIKCLAAWPVGVDWLAYSRRPPLGIDVMSDTPGDYYIGIVDFFGVLVPGAVAVCLLTLQNHALATRIETSLNLGGSQGIVAFTVVSYLAGYLFHVTSLALDRLTAQVQHRWFKKFHQRLLSRTSELMNQCLEEGDRGLVRPLAWALANIRNDFPAWAADVERLDAHSALFCSMCLVLTLTALLEFYHGERIWGLCSTGAAVISLFIFGILRWQRIHSVFECYIALHAISRKGVSLDKHPKRSQAE